jgi:hypothetical protein
MNTDTTGTSPRFSDLVAADSDFQSNLEADAANRTDNTLPYRGRSHSPNAARARFINFEEYVKRARNPLAAIYRCPEDNKPGHFLTCGNLLATVIGAEFSVLPARDFNIAIEAMGRHYYDFTTFTESSGRKLSPTPTGSRLR